MTWIAIGSEQENAGSDSAILIGGQRTDAQHLDRVGNPVWALSHCSRAGVERRSEKRRNIAIFGNAAEQMGTFRREVCVEYRLIADRQDAANRFEKLFLSIGEISALLRERVPEAE